jgi:Holliday junction resolvase RusA-like endonuclease
VTEPAVQFWVAGAPRPQGSFIARVVKGQAYVVPVNDAALKAWRGNVAARAAEAWAASPWAGTPLEGGVRVRVQFSFVRPKSAPGRVAPHVKPDVDKLARAVLDALTGIVYVDDAQVVTLTASKIYRPSGPGAFVAVGAADGLLTLPTL